MDFSQAEREFHRLKNRYIKAEIEARMFEELVNDLFVEDEAGNRWQMGVNSGNWYRFVHHHWVVDIPPLQKQANCIGLPLSVQPQFPSTSFGKEGGNYEYLPRPPEKMSHFPERMGSLRAVRNSVLLLPPWLLFGVIMAMMMTLVMLFLRGR
jgi:hypothetical protein